MHVGIRISQPGDELLNNRHMKAACLSILSLFLLLQMAAAQSPLANYSAAWNAAKYKACNTAGNARYMSEEERVTIYVLNLARTNPKLFCETVVKPYCEEAGIDMNSEHYYKSLVREMNKMAALSILQPDSACWASAACHAEAAGKSGYTGHERKSSKCQRLKRYNGECCSYGTNGAVGVVVTLLVDEGVENLGHREILLTEYRKIGVATRPHSGYRTNTVLDLMY